MIVKVKNEILIFNLFNGNAFLNIVILYFLLMRGDVWFANHLVCLFVCFFFFFVFCFVLFCFVFCFESFDLCNTKSDKK